MKALTSGFLINYPVSALAAESCAGEVFVPCNASKNTHLQICIKPTTGNVEPKLPISSLRKVRGGFR